MKVRLFSSWRGHPYGSVVDMEDNDHTWMWLGLGLCELVDDWDEPGVQEVGGGMLRDGQDDKQGQADVIG